MWLQSLCATLHYNNKIKATTLLKTLHSKCSGNKYTYYYTSDKNSKDFYVLEREYPTYKKNLIIISTSSESSISNDISGAQFDISNKLRLASQSESFPFLTGVLNSSRFFLYLYSCFWGVSPEGSSFNNFRFCTKDSSGPSNSCSILLSNFRV